jgi:putative endonuclease
MKSKEQNLRVGRLGEELAREHLRKKGYKVLEQNYRTRYAEIDLIVKEKDTLVIVEVRTKIGERFGTPEDTLNNKKLQKVKKNAAAYAAQSKWNKVYRVDAVCIVLAEDHSVQRFNHYINI